MQEALTPELARRCAYEECEVDLSTVLGLKDQVRYCSDPCRRRQYTLNRQRAARKLTSKLCGRCQEVLPIEKFTKPWLHYCRPCAAAKTREDYAQNGGSDRVYAQCLRRNYGMTLEEYNERRSAQNGRCAICGDKPSERLNVDHNHATGAIRDLLCRACNHALGNAREDPARLKAMIAYLERHSR